MTAPRRHARVRSVASCLLAATLLGTGVAIACGPWLTFRAYLRRSFWQPVRHFSDSLAAGAPTSGGTAAYAGFAADDAPRPLADLRASYQEIATSLPDDDRYREHVEAAQRAAAAALAPNALSGPALEEARLVDAKVAMRAAVDAQAGSLADARQKLEAFLASKPSPANASEARGWLARVLYKQGDAVAAARIYLEELDGPSPVVPPAALATSMRMVFVGHEDQFWERAETFFDNPRHALFIVNVLTNPPIYQPYSPEDQASGGTPPPRAAKILALLRATKDIFAPGADSDALSMALMRVSLSSGDLAGVLRDAQAVAQASPLRRQAEFNWMVASAHYLGGEYAKAEEPLRRMLAAPDATPADRLTAAQALLAVCLKLGRRVDALHAALVGAATGDASRLSDLELEMSRPQWCVSCDSQDLPYLLDAVLTKAELAAYLQKYPAPIGQIRVMADRKMSAPEIVEYSLAVRDARDGHYSTAAEIYAKLGVPARAERVRKLAAFAARAADASLPRAARLQARYDLAAYLADNPDRILFNDLLWHGYQRMALTGSESPFPGADRESGMTAEEHHAVVVDDRRLKDEQEERWQAYLLLEQVAKDAAGAPLAPSAVLKILDTLPRINTERFGREEEIAAAIKKWRQWPKTAGSGPRIP